MTSFLRGAPPPKKNPGSAPASEQEGTKILRRVRKTQLSFYTYSKICWWACTCFSCCSCFSASLFCLQDHYENTWLKQTLQVKCDTKLREKSVTHIYRAYWCLCLLASSRFFRSCLYFRAHSRSRELGVYSWIFCSITLLRARNPRKVLQNGENVQV